MYIIREVNVKNVRKVFNIVLCVYVFRMKICRGILKRNVVTKYVLTLLWIITMCFSLLHRW